MWYQHFFHHFFILVGFFHLKHSSEFFVFIVKGYLLNNSIYTCKKFSSMYKTVHAMWSILLWKFLYVTHYALFTLWSIDDSTRQFFQLPISLCWNFFNDISQKLVYSLKSQCRFFKFFPFWVFLEYGCYKVVQIIFSSFYPLLKANSIFSKYGNIQRKRVLFYAVLNIAHLKNSYSIGQPDILRLKTRVFLSYQ